RLGLKERQRLVERHDGHAADLDRVQLLEAVERARGSFFNEVRKSADGNLPAVRAVDVGVLQLLGVEARAALELWDDLVTAALEVEAIDVISAHQRGEVRADGLEVEAEHGDLVTVDGKLNFRLV